MCLSSICSNCQEWIHWKWRLMLGIWSGKRRGERWNVESAVCRLWLWITAQILHHGGAVAVLDKQVEALKRTHGHWDTELLWWWNNTGFYTQGPKDILPAYINQKPQTHYYNVTLHIFSECLLNTGLSIGISWTSLMNETPIWPTTKREYHAKNFPKKERFTSYLYKIASKYLALLEISSASSHRNKPLNTLRM